MFSKFSVLSKFYKYFNFKQHGMRNIFSSECRSSKMSSQRNITKTSTNILIPERTNNVVFGKNENNFEIFRNMSSNHNSNKGDGQNNKKINKTNKNLIKKYKKKILRRRSKMKGLKSSQKKCKRFDKQKDLNNYEILINKIDQNGDMSIKDANNLQMEFPEVINNQSILESQLPPKKVHVEFMESQNLKDFNINKNLTNPTNKIKQNVIDIKITPIGTPNDEKSLNIESIKNDIKNIIYNLETQRLTKSNQDNTNLPMLRSGRRGSLKETSQQSIHPIEAPYKINKNISKGMKTKYLEKLSSNFENKLQDIHKDFSHKKTIEDHNNRDTNSTRKNSNLNENFSNIDNNILSQKVSKKSENIRILYQAHPKRKTKIKIPKTIQSKKVKQIKRLQEKDKSDSTIKIVHEPNAPFKRRGILFPTKPGEYLNLKIKSKHFKSNMLNPFVTVRKGILYPTKISGNQVIRSFKPKPVLKNNEIKLNGETPSPLNDNKMKPLPNIDTDLLNIPTTKLQYMNNDVKAEISKDTRKQTNSLSNISNDILKLTANRNKIAIKNLSPIADSSINKVSLSSRSNNDINSKSSTVNFKNKFNKSNDKLKYELNTMNQVSQGSRPSSKRNNKKHGTGTIKTNKLTKYKRSSKSGNRGGSWGGNDGDNKTINSETTTTTKARPSKFWRTISITILPLLFGLTIYTMSNIGAVDILKSMRDARSSEDPLSMKLLPTFYGKNSKTEQSRLKKTEEEEENNKDDHNIEDHVKDHRLDDA